jgi:hypothetical protein
MNTSLDGGEDFRTHDRKDRNHVVASALIWARREFSSELRSKRSSSGSRRRWKSGGQRRLPDVSYMKS